MEQQKNAPKEIRAVANFLRSSKSGMKTRIGVVNGKRVDYFRGKYAVKALLSPAYAKLKHAPKVTSQEDAIKVLNSVIPFAFYLRVNLADEQHQQKGSPKQLVINQMQAFRAEDLFAWFYEGPMWTTYLAGLGMVGILLAAVMFPLWPSTLKQGVWYLSIGFLGLIGLFIVIAILRLIFYVITVVTVPPGIWIFPKLFADVGVIESFIPFWEWDLPKKSKKARKAEKEERAKAKGKEKEKTNDVEERILNTTLHGLAPPTGPAQPTSPASASDVETSGDSRPTSRTARVEDAPDED